MIMTTIKVKTIPTIQDVIDKAKQYMAAGLSQNEAIRHAVSEVNVYNAQRGITLF